MAKYSVNTIDSDVREIMQPITKREKEQNKRKVE